MFLCTKLSDLNGISPCNSYLQVYKNLDSGEIHQIMLILKIVYMAYLSPAVNASIA